MMRCPKCGTENRDSAKFCDECGYGLPAVAPYAHEMFSQDAAPGAPAGPGPSSAPAGHPAAGAAALDGDAAEDDFAALFNDSGTVKLTHIAEKLRKPERSGSFVFMPGEDDAPASAAISPDGSVGADAPDDIFLDMGRGAFSEESGPGLLEADAAAAFGAEPERDDAFSDALDPQAIEDPYPAGPPADEEPLRSSFDLGDEGLAGDGVLGDGLYDDGLAEGIAEDGIPEGVIAGGGIFDDPYDDDIYSIDTAPLSTADVHHAIEEDDQSTMLASAAALAHAQRMRSQQSPSSTLEMPVVASGSGARKDAHSFLAFSSGRNRRFSKRFKTGFVIALCVIAALIAVLGITYALQIWGGKTIPDVMGASSSDAKYLLEESGFFVEEKLIVSDDVEGIVIEVWPETGSRQPLGSTVTIGVSTFRVIPDIVGMPLEEAQALLGENGYTDIELVMKKSNEDEGSVLGVSPAVGTRANAETHVTVEVAQPYLVPDVVGDMRDDAVSALAAEGFTAEIAYDYSNTDPEGSVMRTVPAAGEPCKTTTPVQVVIAVSRETELGNLTSAMFDGIDTFTYNGNMYQYVKGSFATAGCPDNNTLDFTVRGRLLDMHTWPDGRTDTWVGNEVTIGSTVGWSDSNEFLYMDPNLLG